MRGPCASTEQPDTLVMDIADRDSGALVLDNDGQNGRPDVKNVWIRAVTPRPRLCGWRLERTVSPARCKSPS
ncbi:MAG: hypothetical protein AB8F26_07270 [Phycisphaerales bacterium]